MFLVDIFCIIIFSEKKEIIHVVFALIHLN